MSILNLLLVELLADSFPADQNLALRMMVVALLSFTSLHSLSGLCHVIVMLAASWSDASQSAMNVVCMLVGGPAKPDSLESKVAVH